MKNIKPVFLRFSFSVPVISPVHSIKEVAIICPIRNRGPALSQPLVMQVLVELRTRHDGRLLRNFLPVVSLKKFLAHRDIHLVPFEA